MELKEVKYNEIPNRIKISEFFKLVRDYLFPNYFREVKNKESVLNEAKIIFKDYISSDDNKCELFFNSLGEVYRVLLTDIEMTYNSDPACNSMEESLITYPGIYAIIVYRISHELYKLGLKTISRMLSELAHSKTGIDIHPGATIGESFFIDHGTGVVIGETTEIGHHVKIYQGVTLGALSISNANELRGVKRHPTIGNYSTIYAGATILGGDTIIGDNTVIGSNVFIKESLDKNQKVFNKEIDKIYKSHH